MTTRALGLGAVLGFALALGCGRPQILERVVVTSEDVDLSHATWTPADAVPEARLTSSGALELALSSSRTIVRVIAPGGCEIPVTARGTNAVTMPARVRLPRFIADVGYDADVDIAATSGCGKLPKIAWRVVSGRGTLDVREDGHHATVHTPTLASALEPHGATLPSWGIVPISARAQEATELEASWVENGATLTRRVRVVAATRATGIPTIAVGSRAYLFGEDWHVEPNARHALTTSRTAGFTTVSSPSTARVTLLDGAGKRLSLRVGRYDELPLDCSRAGCHVEAGQTIHASPMSHVLERGLSGALGASYDPSCAISCHAMGEPGVKDGGFVHVSELLGAPLPKATSASLFDELPRPLRRAANVGCIACHGPAAIPELAARPYALRSDVCATCHDAPPKYGHFAAWSRSRMALADRDPATRTGDCARCHTTAGFLVRLGQRPPGFAAPPDAGAIGIACAACHSPHAQSVTAALVRMPPKPPWLTHDVGTSAVCLPCHGGDEDGADLPRASAARLVLEGGGPHDSPLGCLACHGKPGDRAGEEHGRGHAFATRPEACASCHEAGSAVEKPDARGRLVAQRAEALFAALVAKGVVRTSSPGKPHASQDASIDPRASAELARAARDVAFVLSDPAAGIHAAAKARALLDAAEAAISAR